MQNKFRLLLPALAALALGACDGGTGSDTGRVSIRLVDAPGDLAEAWVQIEEIYLQGGSEADSTGGRLQLAGSSDTYYNLLDLTNGNFAPLVNNAVVPSGTYSRLRVVIGEAYVVTEDGDVYATSGATLPAGVARDGNLQRTRGKSSGYQVTIPGGLTVDGDSKIAVLDFDVNQSFGHVAGNSGNYIMHPAFTVTEIGMVAGITGTVTATGITFPACGGAATDVSHFVATATAGTTTVTAKANAAGAYTMPYVTPATYTMGVAPVAYANGDSLTFAATPTPPSVALTSGQTATVNYAVASATCKVKPAG